MQFLEKSLKHLKIEKNSEQSGSQFDSRSTQSTLTQKINALREDQNDSNPSRTR